MNESIQDAIHTQEQLPGLLPGGPMLLPVPYEHTENETEFIGEGYRVVLYDDDFHTMEEVERQLIKALHCSKDIAEDIMLRAHHLGRATVMITDKDEAEQIAEVLREINLRVTIDRV